MDPEDLENLVIDMELQIETQQEAILLLATALKSQIGEARHNAILNMFRDDEDKPDERPYVYY